MPPDFGVFAVVPIDGGLLVTLPIALRGFLLFPVFVQVVNHAAFRSPVSLFVHGPHGEQNMGVGIAVALVVHGDVGDHALGYELFLTVFPHQLNLLLFGDFLRQRHDDAPGELGIVSGFGPLHAVPQRVPVGQLRRRVGRREDGREYHLLLVAVMLGLLIVLAEKPVTALVGGSGHRGLTLAALHNLDVEMGTGQTASPPDVCDNGFSMG